MKLKSEIIPPGIYQWEWCADKIAVTRWDEIPTSTDQWLLIGAPKDMRVMFYLEGTDNDDICVMEALLS